MQSDGKGEKRRKVEEIAKGNQTKKKHKEGKERA